MVQFEFILIAFMIRSSGVVHPQVLLGQVPGYESNDIPDTVFAYCYCLIPRHLPEQHLRLYSTALSIGLQATCLSYPSCLQLCNCFGQQDVVFDSPC